MSRVHSERHNIGRIGWLRAAVLGANDGIVSTSSLLMGVAAAAAGNARSACTAILHALRRRLVPSPSERTINQHFEELFAQYAQLQRHRRAV